MLTAAGSGRVSKHCFRWVIFGKGESLSQHCRAPGILASVQQIPVSPLNH